MLSNLSSEEFIQLKKNITSLLNTTDIIDFNDHIVVSSTGGVYIYDDEDSFSLNEELNILNISSLSVYENYLWIGSKGVGEIQIFDSNFNLYTNIEYPKFDEILDGRVKTLHPLVHVLLNLSHHMKTFRFLQ